MTTTSEAATTSAEASTSSGGVAVAPDPDFSGLAAQGGACSMSNGSAQLPETAGIAAAIAALGLALRKRRRESPTK